MLILFREIGITLIRLSIVNRKVISANRGGKIKSLLQNFSVGFYILPLPENLYLPRDILLGAAVILTITTGLDYLRNALDKTK